MLALSGARQMSGNNVRMSIRIARMRTLLDDLECGPLTVTRGGAGQQSPDGLDSLAVSANDAPDVGLAQLHAEDRHFSRGDLRKHHLIREFDQLANDKLEELFH